MLEHHRRMHKESNSDSIMLGASPSEYEENEEEAILRSASIIDPDSRPESNQASPAMVEVPVEVPASFNKEKYNPTTLYELGTVLEVLKDEERKFSQEIDAMTTSLGIMEDRAKGNASTSTLQDLETGINTLKEQKDEINRKINAVTTTIEKFEGR